MKIEVNIDEQELQEIITNSIVKKVLTDGAGTWEGNYIKRGVRDGISKAVKEYIYSDKEMIIDRVVERAAREMVKKGFNKFFEKQEVTHD